MIRFNDRVFVVGHTGSGKSTLSERLFASAAAGPRMVIDPADSKLTDIAGATTVHGPPPRTDDVRERVHQELTDVRFAGATTIRYVPGDATSRDEIDAVYEWLFDRFPMFVWLDEAGIAAPATGSPPNVTRVLVQGRKRQLGHMACHTRPVEVNRNLVSQSQHVFIFDLPHPADRDAIAKLVGLPMAVLEAELARLPKYGFLAWDVAARELTVCPPLTVGAVA